MIKAKSNFHSSYSQLYLLISVSLSIWVVSTAGHFIRNDMPENEHQKFILSGVTAVLKTRTPGSISLLNEKTFPILAGENGGTLRPHVAGVEYGEGRIVAFSHSSFYLVEDLENTSDNIRLVINSVNWARKSGGKKIGIRGKKGIGNVLREHGFDVHDLLSGNFNNLTLLKEFDAVLTDYVENENDSGTVRTYVRNGGGLLIAGTSWNSYINDMETFWGNIVLRDTGLFYIGRYYMYGTMECPGECFNASLECLRDTSAFQVWNDFKELNWNQTISLKRIPQMMEIMLDRLRDGPTNETLYNEISIKVKGILKQIPIVIPTEAAPVTAENEKKILIVHHYLCLLLNSIGFTKDIPPHPAAIAFPGAINSVRFTSGKERFIKIDAKLPHWAEKVSLNERKLQSMKMETIICNGNDYRIQNKLHPEILENIEIDATRPSWHSTGLYAQPGEEIKIRVLNADQSMSDLEVQIGAHSDNIEHFNSWSRCPAIVFRNTMKNGTTTIANPFGGLIYVLSKTYRNMSMTLSLEGGIPSPTYFYGKTTLNQWRNQIKNNPAPWGELVGPSLIITAQSSLLSKLDDPEEVIDIWNRIMDAMANLAAISHERLYAERFVPDVQIGGGYMHSGYPIMYFLESQENTVTVKVMKEEPWRMWGYLHELGHNHQKGDWTFLGTGEVTCNLFTLYVMHEIFECPTNETHSGLSDANVAQRLKEYTENGRQFSQWKSDNFLALDIYIQLQETFGWSAYQHIFANYQQLTEDERPQNDQEKIDLWMVMFSKVVEENLAEFFISWGFPISAEAETLVSHFSATTLRIPQPI